ncbi:RICIN domain-containing protein [Herbidospora cretacea]|uniref:RICIN domain-containing protein n=1 Tax=Herbidospora cretacea TaxID=28444 RepID=UPI0009ED7B76|nr:RICIN domain-containing protein [Herbidospora cretacea]
MRGRLAGALAAGTLLLGLGATAANAASPTLVVNYNSGQCLEVNNASLAAGAGVLQWTCHGGNHQRWRVIDLGNGYVRLQVEHSAQCLEVNNASLAAGAGVLQWPCHGGTHQQWQRINTGGGYYLYKARHSSQCLEVSNGSFWLGAGVLQWPCHGGNHQRWTLVP